MFPTKLGIASLRQTKRLRKKTGQKRSVKRGARHGFCMGLFCISGVFADLASGEFEKKVF